MLKFSVNNKNLRIRQEVIASYDKPADYYMTLDDNVIEIEVPDGNCWSVVEDDILSFYRNEGEPIRYYEERFIKEREYGENIVRIRVSGFTNVNLMAVSAKVREIDGEEYLLLKFDKDHYANEANKTIKRVISSGDDISDLCPNDIFVKDQYFKYRKTGEGGSVNISPKCVLYWESGLDHSITSRECIVPCTIEGVDMKKTLALRLKDRNGVVDEGVRLLYNNFRNFRCWVKDQRFFSYNQTDDNFWVLTLKSSAEIRLRKGDPVINFGINTDFSPYLLLEDGVLQFLEKSSKNRTNKVVDYEKQQFLPVISGSSLYDVEKIMFCIHLRERDSEWNVIPSGGWVSINDIDNTLENNDFSEDDIYYQRKCVSETFLRLSFYDKVDVGTQKLLYTAKLYLDENRLWSEYVKQKNESDINLPFCFTCTNKYDYNSKTEGFYLHLFTSNIKTMEEQGEQPTIYMRAELFSAKYGKKIPLTLPVYPNTKPESADTTYPQTFNGDTYMDTNNGRTNMKKLNNDMYIKVYISHDEEHSRYVWSIGKATQSDDAGCLEIHLYEPKMF